MLLYQSGYVDGVGENPGVIVAVDFEAVGAGARYADWNVAAVDFVVGAAVVDDAVSEASSFILRAVDLQCGEFAEGRFLSGVILAAVGVGAEAEACWIS